MVVDTKDIVLTFSKSFVSSYNEASRILDNDSKTGNEATYGLSAVADLSNI